MVFNVCQERIERSGPCGLINLNLEIALMLEVILFAYISALCSLYVSDTTAHRAYHVSYPNTGPCLDLLSWLL